VVFDSLKTASQKDKCFWMMNSEGDTVNYTQMSALKYVMYFVVEEISKDIENHQARSAIEKLSWGFSCARHLKQQADASYLLHGEAIEGMYNIAFYNVIVGLELSESHLNELSTLLQFNLHDWGLFLDRLAEYSTLRNKVKFTSTIYEINSENKVRFSGNVMGVGISMLDNWYMLPFMSSDIENEYWRERGSKIARVINWWYVPSSPADFIAMFDEQAYLYPLMDTSIHNQSFFQEISWKTAMFNCNYLVKLNVLLQVDAIYNIPKIGSRIQSGQIAGHILLAMKQYHNQHNQWPESLSLLTTIQPGLQLADPLNNGEYVYNVANDEFRLYSKGLNGVDEGGEYYQNADDLLIWPRELEDSD
jgi:hypothetical protein